MATLCMKIVSQWTEIFIPTAKRAFQTSRLQFETRPSSSSSSINNSDPSSRNRPKIFWKTPASTSASIQWLTTSTLKVLRLWTSLPLWPQQSPTKMFLTFLRIWTHFNRKISRPRQNQRCKICKRWTLIRSRQWRHLERKNRRPKAGLLSTEKMEIIIVRSRYFLKFAKCLTESTNQSKSWNWFSKHNQLSKSFLLHFGYGFLQ